VACKLVGKVAVFVKSDVFHFDAAIVRVLGIRSLQGAIVAELPLHRAFWVDHEGKALPELLARLDLVVGDEFSDEVATVAEEQSDDAFKGNI
jgi:hypothetical protein